MDRIYSIFNQQELSLKEKVIEILRLKNKKPIVILLNESRDKIAEIHEFKSMHDFDKFLSKIPGKVSRMIFYIEDKNYVAGIKHQQESWSFTFDGINKIEMKTYSSTDYPLSLSLKEIIFEIKKDILAKIS
jgi:hypothetical protein